MSTTKVVDGMRDVTVVDAAKITTGAVPAAALTNVDLVEGTKGTDIVSAGTMVIGTDGGYFDITGTTGISTMTVAAGRVFTLQFDAAVTLTHSSTLYLSGAADFTTEANDHMTFISVAANDVRQIGTGLKDGGSPVAAAAVDLTPVTKDISLLALQTAINGNLSAYGLTNSWIEQFEDSTYIENLTQVARSPREVAGTPAYVTGDRTSHITLSFSGFTFAGGTPSGMLDGTLAAGISAWATAMTPSSGAYMRFAFSDNNSTGSTKKLITETKWYQNTTHNGATWKWQGSNDTVSWTDLGANFTMGDGLTANVAHVNDGDLSSNTVPYTYYQMLWVSGANHASPYWYEIFFEQADVTVTAGQGEYMGTDTGSIQSTGSFNSTDITPQDGASKSSVGIVILYKNGAGTATLNTHLVVNVRANTGQAYQEVVLAGAGTYSNGLKIAIAPAISVTAGTALSYEIEFAGQSGSLETRVHGVAMTY